MLLEPGASLPASNAPALEGGHPDAGHLQSGIPVGSGLSWHQVRQLHNIQVHPRVAEQGVKVLHVPHQGKAVHPASAGSTARSLW